jgi:serine O-acetyltransferase
VIEQPTPSYLVQHRRLTRWLPVLHRLSRGERTQKVANALTRVVFNADISCGLDLPPGVVFLHNGLGTVVHPKVRFLGPAIVGQHATLGLRFNGHDGVPTIGADVMIGTGAVVIGPIEIGAGSVVAANAVVTRDVPPGSLATGVPASCRPVECRVIDELFGPLRQSPSDTPA